MAEAVTVGIAGKIVAYLVPQALGNVGMLRGVNHELEALGDIVSTLQSVLDHAEEQNLRGPQIKDGVDKLKEAFYDAQDVLEEFNIEAMRRELRGHNEMMKEIRTFFSSSNQLAFKMKMRYKLRDVRERIEAIKADRGFHLDERPEREWRKREETHSFIGEGDIIGREDDKKKIMKFLLDSDVQENVSILPIVGIGGLGKTALAQSVYKDEMVSKQFDLKLWVCVSVDFDMKKILKTIIAREMKEPTEIAMEWLRIELKGEIDGRRYLLVLDDLWSVQQEEWLELKILLLGGARGSKVLITTRLSSVADITGTTRPHFLEGLSESASLKLLMKMTGCKEEEIEDHNMQAIGKGILKKCYGVPLALRTIGSLLFQKSKLEWSDFIENELPKIPQSERSISSILELSYHHLPLQLKQCFMFCSLFPKDYEIKKQTLVNLWMAEGFIQQSHRSQHLEDIGHQYFMDLLWSNFFQDFQKDSFKDKETCKIPALMHDLACSVARHEYWVAWDDKKSIHERIRHISHGLTSNLMDELPISLLKASSLRTFLSTPTSREMEQREPTGEADLWQLIQSFKRLRILDLHAAIVKKVPRSICKLKHLTYLDLSHNSTLKRLPNSITRLQNLQTLNLQGCSALEELPRDIRKLVSLRNLDIDYCYNLSYVPHGLGQLSSLHRLTRFIFPKGKALNRNYCGLGELNGLNNIRGNLSIENLGHSRDAIVESRMANLKGKCFLESLTLKWGYLDIDDAVIGDTDRGLLEELMPHSNLRKLTIDGYESESFPNWMTDSLVLSLPYLVEVRLLRCGKCKHLPQLSQLPHLKSLEIWRLTELKCFEPDHSCTSTTSFPSLVKLEIRHCENLEAMPQTPHLEDLNLKEVNRELINRIFGPNKLKTLHISQMEFLECLPEECLQSFTSLERLGISKCPRLTSLSGMRHLSNLVRLSFSNCENLDLSKGESNNILDSQGLKSLQFVDILGVPKLASLPQWLLHVSNLEYLSIKKCSNLKALPDQIEAFQSLQQLEIVWCPSLTSLPEGMQRLTSLSHLKIAGCPNLEERCIKDEGEDWYKIVHIPHKSHKLEYYERHL